MDRHLHRCDPDLGTAPGYRDLLRYARVTTTTRRDVRRGRRLRQWRDRTGITQQQLADAARVSVAQVDRWERGVTAVPAVLLDRLCIRTPRNHRGAP